MTGDGGTGEGQPSRADVAPPNDGEEGISGTETRVQHGTYADATADRSTLPVPATEGQPSDLLPSIESRPYIEIRPSETTVDPETVRQAMEHLHSLLIEHTSDGLLPSIRSTAPPPLVEWLVVADGSADSQLRYLIGTSHSDLTPDLMTVLRTCFPATYEFRHVEFHPRAIEEFLPVGQSDTGAEIQLSTGESIDTTCVPYVAGVEYRGHVDRRRDWQTPLASFGDRTRGADRTQTPRADRRESRRIPLATLIETLRDADVPVVYQVVCRPYDDWTDEADSYIQDLETGLIGPVERCLEFLSPRTPQEKRQYQPAAADRERITAIQERDQRRSFQVAARAVALTRSDRDHADHVARRLSTALGSLNGPHHEIQGHVVSDADLHTLPAGAPGLELYRDLITRAMYSVRYRTLKARLPTVTPQSRTIVATAAELPGFCVVDGARLTPGGQRALATRASEQTALLLPPPSQLAQYTGPGMVLCMPLTHDRRPYGRPFVLPPAYQNRHVVVVGDTGAGKSVLIESGMVTNVAATDGPDILFDYKGGGTAEEYLRCHYAAYGDLDDVLYFDLSRVLPAFSFFDIRPLLDAGVPREEARSRKAGHYEAIAAGVMGVEAYGQAAESTKAIRNHLRALYDPVHGTDVVTHADLYDALARTQRRDGVPSCADDSLETYFARLIDRDRETFNKIMAGAVGRVETIATDGRLAPVFNHAPTDVDDDQSTAADSGGDEGDGDGNADGESRHATADGATDATPDRDGVGGGTEGPRCTGHAAQPAFDCTDLIDEDTVVVFDFGGMEASIKRTLTLVILSNLWTALKARDQRRRREGVSGDPPQVNLYLEEARDVGGTALLDTLLAEGRSFGLSVTLGLQFLEQLQTADDETDSYREALNETATFVVGNVSVETDLARVLATDEMDPDAVDRRLTTMGRGEWLVRPGTAFGTETVRPFLAQSLPAPRGHPAGEHPLTGSEEQAFQDAFEAVQRRTARTAGLRQHEPGELDHEEDDAEDGDDVSEEEASSAAEEAPTDEVVIRRPAPLLARTKRLPDPVEYDRAADALRCVACDNRYDSDIDGMVDAIECCHSLDDVDRDDIPVCDSNLKLTPEEIAESEWSYAQLLFLQTVYNAQQLRYDSLEYDLTTDSMVRLEEYVGIDREAVRELVRADLLRHDTDHPHRLYSVSPAGRTAIGESHRRGVDYGDGKGDLTESTEHVLGVELAARLLRQEYRDDPDSAVTVVRRYHELDENMLPAAAFMGDGDDAAEATDEYHRRLDVAGLDDDGNVIVAVEVERVNNDVKRAVPDDYDKMAACDPEEAIWVVMTRSDGHEILERLNDPPDGETRVDKEYSHNTPPQDFRIDEPGLTAVYPVQYVRDSLLQV